MPFRSLSAAVLMLLVTAGAASAQEPGIQFDLDPDSPAQKEYAIPLDQARSYTSGRGATTNDGQRPAPPLFGVGIKRARQPSSENASKGSGTAQDQRTRRSGAGTGEEPRERVAAVRTSSAGGWGDQVAAPLALALAVLALGAAVGLAVRASARLRAG